MYVWERACPRLAACRDHSRASPLPQAHRVKRNAILFSLTGNHLAMLCQTVISASLNYRFMLGWIHMKMSP
jgi:hypothetical protein